MASTQQLLLGEGAGGAEKNYIEDVFSTYLYTGTGATNSINNAIDLSTKGGLTWIKSRDSTPSHNLFDTVRGATKLLVTNSTAAQTTDATTLTSFNSNGFTLGADTTNNAVNRAGGYTYASWTFRKQPKFFDVVTYTGNDTTQNIAHSLGSTPGCVIVKCTNAAAGWYVWHRGQTAGYYSILNTTAAQTNGSSVNTFGNNTTYVDPTSTQFTVGSNGNINQTGNTYVAYLFAHDAGGFGLTGTDNVISCGSYTGNGSATGPTVTLGYEPQWVMVKNVSAVGYWYMLDAMRGMSLTASNELAANSSAAENAFYGGTAQLAPQATGFQIINSGTQFNTSGQTYIYIAIRRGPMKVPTDGTTVYNALAYSGSGTDTQRTMGFTPDYFGALIRSTTQQIGGEINGTRLTGSAYRATGSNGADDQLGAVSDYFRWDNMTGMSLKAYQGLNASGYTYVAHSFKRAPSFFDVVCYAGNSTAGRAVTHNLGVAPELIIVKDRAANTSGWRIYAAPLGNTQHLYLERTDGTTTSTTWNNTSPTASVFYLAGGSAVNGNTLNYVAYLFATCAGVSKVGSYTGNGSSQTINCGFTAGARFVMIKRTDSTGDWYVWDTSRGIVAGNDPHLSLNTTAAEVTTDDTIDAASSGFIVNQLAATNVNVNTATYIFFAIA